MINVDSGSSLQSTLTCIAIHICTGGPPTTVTWTRDAEPVTEGAETELDDRVTAQYTHTLSVTGKLGGLYCNICTAANDKPSTDSTDLAINAYILLCES